MTHNELYTNTVNALKNAGIENPDIDARRLIENCFKLSLSQQILASHTIIDPSRLSYFDDTVQRRKNREPLQYILGQCEFWSLKFIVSPDVLIPRQETEFLLHHILSAIKKSFKGGPIIDMCTGSGVIAVVLATELQPATILALDNSLKALHIARQNLMMNHRQDCVKLICSDLFNGLKQDQKYEVFVSNPPYIAENDIPFLQPEVRDWEPQTALKAGVQGLDIIRRIHKHAPAYLQDNGWIFLEIGSGQGDAVFRLFTERNQGNNYFKNVAIIKDWSGRDRVLQAQIAF
jgi:release factor glutamine methyltransferase